MKRLKIMKSYVILWLFIYFLIYSNLEYMIVFFMATLTFNIAVLTILTIGIIMIMKAAINLVMLAGTFGTLAYKKKNLEFYLQDMDKLMPANIAHMFHARAKKGMLLFTTEESRDVIEWIEEKFSNQNKYTNYFTGTVLMIGLLGTFSGLLIAIDQMGTIILSLSGDIDLGKVIAGFAGPLGGMAVGFGSSLFGVISAIILGLMGYILNKNQETFVEGVEDWLKGRIIDSGGATTATAALAGNDMPEHKASFMDVFIENLGSLSSEMSKISTSNEQLTSITVASVQQARDEHEVSIELFQDISDSLKNIDANAKDTTNILGQQFTSLQISMNTNHNQLISQQHDALHLMIEKLELALESTHSKITQKFQDISDVSSLEIKDRVSQIAILLKGIDSELKSKEQLLVDIKESGEVRQDENEKLLKQLISLFKESSDKLDSEQEILGSIYKHLDDDSKSSKENFDSISSLIQSFSQTLQNELLALDTLQTIQKSQSEIIEDSVEKSKDIHETLLKSQEQNEKQEIHLSAITSKIDSVKEQMSEVNSKSMSMLNEKLSPLLELSNSSKNQESSLVDLLELTKQDSKEQQDSLHNIATKIDTVKDEFYGINQENAKFQKASLDNIASQIDLTKQDFLEVAEKKDELAKTQFEELTSKVDTVKDEFYEIHQENAKFQKASLDNIASQIDLTKQELIEVSVQKDELSKTQLEELTSKIDSVNEKSLEGVDSLNAKLEDINEQSKEQSSKNIEKISEKIDEVSDSITDAIVNNKASSSSKKSGGFFDKIFS